MKELLDALNQIANSILNPKDAPRKYISLSEESTAAFLPLIKALHAPKGHILVAPGKVSTNIYFILKGFARIYYYKDGKEITESFRAENNILHSAVSLITKKPDKRGIEIIEPSDLLYINYNEFESLFKAYPQLESMAHVFTNVSIILLQKRLDGLLFETAESRYKNMLRMFPDILQRLPLGMIATYLGITQETLSRIRGRY